MKVALLLLCFVFACLCQTTPTRTVINPTIPTDTASPTPISDSASPSVTPSKSPSRTPTSSRIVPDSRSPSASRSVDPIIPSESPSASKSIPSVVAVSIAPNITLTPTATRTVQFTVYNGPNSQAVEFELFACGGSCNTAQIRSIIASIAIFLGIPEEDIEITTRNGVLFLVVCTNDPDSLLNAISSHDEDLSNPLLEQSTIVSEPIYLDECPIVRYEESSGAEIILASLFSVIALVL